MVGVQACRTPIVATERASDVSGTGVFLSPGRGRAG